MELKPYKYELGGWQGLMKDMMNYGPTPPDLSELSGYRKVREYHKWWLSLTDEERTQVAERRTMWDEINHEVIMSGMDFLRRFNLPKD